MNLVKYCFLVMGLSFFSYESQSQQITVSGMVIDGESLEDLSGVHVFLESHIGTVTDIDGKFHFKLNFLDTLHFSRVGYDSLSIVITEVDKFQNLFISMKKGVTILDDVEVTGIYQSNTILKKAKQKPFLVPGIVYPVNPKGKNYNLGLAALASPMTALYRMFSKSYKEEKKSHELQKKWKVEDAEFARASKKLSIVFSLTDTYLDEYFYRDFIQFGGLTTRFVAESTEYELLKVLPKAIEQYYKHLKEEEEE
ncbi:carboxypeptidase-like regulatory domain-containing protein [Reichenbachiella sp. MALMAid0571]|uniref:carboxypeptidase-like regulatory domain-containing protein n=1 Tax=Reichenbachiella sp. MALMAid0571 TaxID=3143939 RepID=UPI0032DFEA74